MAGGVAEHQLGARGDERVAVDLPVRVAEGDADLGAPVLEAEDLGDLVEGGEGGRAVGPGGEDQRGLLLGEVGEGRVVVGGEADDLAAAGVAGQGGEAVLEDRDVVVVVGDLAVPSVPGGAERAGVGRRVVGAGLAVRGDGDRVAEQRVAADLGRGRDGVQGALVDGVTDGVVREVVVDQLAAVGEGRHRLLHQGPPPDPLNIIAHNKSQAHTIVNGGAIAHEG